MVGGTRDDEFEARFQVLFTCAYQGAYKVLGSRADAEDLAQEALARALVRWEQVSGYAEAWVTRASVNLAIDRWRQLERRSRLFELRDVSAVDEVDFGVRADLVRALRCLSSRQRDVVVLRYLMDLPEREVAALLGCSVGSVKQHASRGLEALRGHLGESFGPGDVGCQSDESDRNGGGCDV